MFRLSLIPPVFGMVSGVLESKVIMGHSYPPVGYECQDEGRAVTRLDMQGRGSEVPNFSFRIPFNPSVLSPIVLRCFLILVFLWFRDTNKLVYKLTQLPI